MRAAGQADWQRARIAGLEVRHTSALAPRAVAEALERHRANVADGAAACEHVAPGSSVSRVRLGTGPGHLDLAVKWSHPRGLRRALAETLRGSRAGRASQAAGAVRAIALDAPEPLAVAERRRLGLCRESFLVMRFVADAKRLSDAAPALARNAARRRALAAAIGAALARLHAAGLDQRDVKPSNFLLRGDASLVFVDLESIAARQRALPLGPRARALGQLDAYALDLYPQVSRTDRLRCLLAYLRHAPGVDRDALVRTAARRRDERLASWAAKQRDRSQVERCA